MQPGEREGLNGTHPRRVTHRALKVRRYAHFDDPLDQSALDGLIISPTTVAMQSFFPLLAYKKTRRRIDFSVFPPIVEKKGRDIKYAGHMDSAIFSIYAQKLTELYEVELSNRKLHNHVLAYRGGIGYNVPFAKSLFDEIKKCENCVVVCLDLAKFFDTLRHDVLKKQLSNLLQCSRLPPDWFAIFRRLTTFEYVEADGLKARLGKSEGKRICGIDAFRSVVRPLIKRNEAGHGIPQGTPLSGVLANLYMLDFDTEVAAWVESRGGSYRRYSDDIAVVLPTEAMAEEGIAAITAIARSIGLSINDSKTCQSVFSMTENGQAASGDLLQYLGFTFDGQAIRIRPESLRAFYAKMKGNVRRSIRSAALKGLPAAGIHKRVLVGRFTHWGDSRNFVQYAFRAARDLNSLAIRRQLRNHVAIFDRHWLQMINKFYDVDEQSSAIKHGVTQ